MTAFGAVLSFRSQALFLDVMVLKADQALLWLGRYTVLLHAIYGDAGRRTPDLGGEITQPPYFDLSGVPRNPRSVR